jgi:hypothetical protein
MIITTGKPTGYLRTDRHYENFVAEFEWMHIPPKKGEVGNSGFFVWCDPLPAVGTGYTRGIEVQVLVNLEWTDKTDLEAALKRTEDPERKMEILKLLRMKTGKSTATSHGDLFSIWGATCEPDRPHPLGWKRSIPSENRANGENEWNHYRVEANDGVIKLAVNGKFVSIVSKCNPRKGYLGLEAEGSECRFKNLKIKELPSTNPKASEICELDQGFKCMFNGLDLSGWKVDDEQKKHWKMSDGNLSHDGKGNWLVSDTRYGDLELIFDFTAPCKILRGNMDGTIRFEPARKGYNRAILRVQGNKVSVAINGQVKVENRATGEGPIAIGSSSAAQFRNVFIRELKKDEK